LRVVANASKVLTIKMSYLSSLKIIRR